MKLPRGVSGDRLIRVLERHGYGVVRQKRAPLAARGTKAPPHDYTKPPGSSLKWVALFGTFLGFVKKEE